jgi:hypothetical protein
MRFEDLDERQQERFNVLEKALAEAQLGMRYDSDLFWDYVFHGDRARISCVATIVLKMKKAKYLHQYCNFSLGYEIAKNSIATVPKQEWLSFVRRCVLSTTTLQAYPSQWPWELNIDPMTWKLTHDRTRYIKKKMLR